MSSLSAAKKLIIMDISRHSGYVISMRSAIQRLFDQEHLFVELL